MGVGVGVCACAGKALKHSIAPSKASALDLVCVANRRGDVWFVKVADCILSPLSRDRDPELRCKNPGSACVTLQSRGGAFEDACVDEISGMLRRTVPRVKKYRWFKLEMASAKARRRGTEGRLSERSSSSNRRRGRLRSIILLLVRHRPRTASALGGFLHNQNERKAGGEHEREKKKDTRHRQFIEACCWTMPKSPAEVRFSGGDRGSSGT